MQIGEKFEAMKTAFDLAFKNAFGEAPSTYEQFAMTVGDPSHSIVKLPFLEQFSCMREWIGPRKIKNLVGKELTITERSFEDTIAIKSRDLETDNWTMYITAVQQMAVNGKSLWDQLAAEALLNPGKWIDSKAFFSTDRKYGETVICNKTTDALSYASFKTAYETMGGYAGHAGKPLGVVPDTLMVGPANFFKAKAIIENEFISDNGTTTSNECRGLVKILLNPRIIGKGAANWYLMCCSGPIKPVAVQKSKEPTLVSKNAPNDEGIFMEDQALFGTAGYGNAAAAFPHLVYGGIAG